jgi:hypothetical protein
MPSSNHLNVKRQNPSGRFGFGDLLVAVHETIPCSFPSFTSVSNYSFDARFVAGRPT